MTGRTSSFVGRSKMVAGGLGALLIVVACAVVGYNLLTSSADGDDPLDPLEPRSAGDAGDASERRTSDPGEEDEADRGDGAAGADEIDTGAHHADDADNTDGADGAGEDDPLDDGYRPPPWSLIAALNDDVPSHSAPGEASDGTLAATWHGRQNALAVVEERPRWLKVRLPERPNGSTAWVRRDDVEVSSTPYRIRIDVGSKRLQLWQQAELVMDIPVGVGTDDAPTPTGEFFVAFLQEPPDDGANWGQFVMVTSAHSESISDFQLSGDAITGIHGPLGSADEIAETGAQVSKGCVRLQLEDLEMLRDVPAGSPIDIIDTSTGTGAHA